MIGYETWGQGPTRIIALPGWFGDSDVYGRVLEALDPEVFQVALMDYRGYGRSRSIEGPYDLATIAEDALALADSLGWPRFHLLGHSMGGKAALKVALRAPDRVERIVAITPVWAGTAPFDAATAQVFRSAAESVPAREAILRNTTGDRYPQAWSRRLAQDSETTDRRDAFAAYFEAWAFEDFAQAARGLPHPVLVVLGAHDAGVPETAAREAWGGGLPQTRFHVMTESGHYPMLEQPAWLASIITKDLQP